MLALNQQLQNKLLAVGTAHRMAAYSNIARGHEENRYTEKPQKLEHPNRVLHRPWRLKEASALASELITYDARYCSSQEGVHCGSHVFGVLDVNATERLYGIALI